MKRFRAIEIFAAVALLALPVRAGADTAGSVNPGTRATQSDLSGCTYNSAGVTVTNGQQVAVQCDSTGNVKVSATVTPSGTQDVNVAQVAGTTTAVGAGAVNAGTIRTTQGSDSPVVTNQTSGGQKTQIVDGSGNVIASTSNSLNVAITSGSTGNAAASNTGAAVPAQAGYTGLNVGGTLRGWTAVNPSGSIYAGQVDVSSIAGTTAVNGSGTATGALRVELPTNGTGVVGLNAGSNIVGALVANQSVNLAQVAGATTATGHGVASGAIRVELPTDGTGVVNAAQSGTWTVQPGNTANTTAWLVTDAAATTGGSSTYAAPGGTGNALLTATAIAVKAAAGSLYGVNFYNPNTSIVYLQFFDVASGSVTLGTTVPKLSYAVPASGWMDTTFGSGSQIAFGTAITVAATTTATGNTAPSTGITANLIYK